MALPDSASWKPFFVSFEPIPPISQGGIVPCSLTGGSSSGGTCRAAFNTARYGRR
jgi:hypothetical protein